MSAKEAPMLDAALQTNEGRLREDSGKGPEGADAERLYRQATLLAKAAGIGAEAASGVRESGWKGDWLVLLQALCSLTARQASEGEPSPCFTAERIRQEIAVIVGAPEAQWWSEDSESARKKFTNAWKALENDIARIDENLRGRAIKCGVPGVAALATPTRLGTTNAMGYGLTVVPLELPPQDTAPAIQAAPQPAAQAAAAIEFTYLEEMEAYPIPGLKRPLRISLPGWRAALIASPLVIALIIGGLLAWFLLTLWISDEPARILFRWTILAGIVAGTLVWLCHPFYTLINDRIVRAPTFLEATLPLGHVLVLRREGDERVLRMLRYTATCPICDGEITIEKGRRQHRGRLVGECGRNPVEHVFSFDFVTARGTRL